MAWHCEWLLEKRSSSGPWVLLPVNDRFSRNAVPTGDRVGLFRGSYFKGMYDFEYELNRIAEEGLPSDASEEARKHFEYLTESHSWYPPFCKHLFLKKVVEVDWSEQMFRPPDDYPVEWADWLDDIMFYGDLADLRLLFLDEVGVATCVLMWATSW